MTGTGTVLNVVAVLVGSAIGVALGSRLPERTRDVVTDGLGLVTLMVAALSASAVLDPALPAAVGSGAVLVVLGAVVVGGVIGSALRLEDRLEALGEWIRTVATRASTRGRPPDAPRPGATGQDAPRGPARQVRPGDAATDDHAAAVRFVDGFVTASLVFCVGPLAILGSLQDGLGRGIDQLALKSALDFFASIAFAASLGWGVAAAGLAVLVYQGVWTLVGATLGGVLPHAQIAAITATGGLLLVAIGVRLLRLRPIPVADLLPAMLVAPVIVALVTALR